MTSEVKTVLVTGSSGRIGSAIVRELSLDSALKVVGLDITPARTTHFIVDLRNSYALKPHAQNADAIVHCAALHAPHVGQRADSDFWKINVDSTKALFEYSHHDCSFVYTSSTSVFGHSLVPKKVPEKVPEKQSRPKAIWVDENLEPKPRDIYDETKLAAERFLQSASTNSRSVTCLRMSRCFPEPLRDMVLYRMYRGVDERDVVQAHQRALKRQAGFQCYVISGPPVFKPKDTFELMHAPWQCILKSFPQLERTFSQRNWAPPTQIDRVYSSLKAINELGYAPQYGVDSLLSLD